MTVTTATDDRADESFGTHAAGYSPRRLALAAGILYLFDWIANSVNLLFLADGQVVSGDPAATLSSIEASPVLFGLGLVVLVAVWSANVGIAVLFYELLRPVNRVLSLVAAAFRVIFVAIAGVSLVAYVLVGALATESISVAGFDGEQVLGVVTLLLTVFDSGFMIALGFFGFHIALLGYLAYRSAFSPDWLGLALVVNAGFLLAVFAGTMLFPAHTETIFYGVAVPAVVEGALAIWLVVAGLRG